MSGPMSGVGQRVRYWSGQLPDKQGMRIRHLFLSGSLLGLGALAGLTPALAQTAPAARTAPAAADAAQGSALRLDEVLQAARQNPDVLAAQRALDAARADVLSANRPPAPVLSAGVSSIDLRNGTGAGSFWTQKRLDKSLGLDWTWERGNKRALRTEVAERSARAAQADGSDMVVMQQIGAQNAFVLRQGLRREQVWPVVAFCALADALLISAGVMGLGQALGDQPVLTRALAWGRNRSADQLHRRALPWVVEPGVRTRQRQRIRATMQIPYLR